MKIYPATSITYKEHLTCWERCPKGDRVQQRCQPICLANRAGIYSHKQYEIKFQTTSGLRTIQIRASPVIAPATKPLVTAMTVVLTAGAMRGSVNSDRTAWLAQ